MSRGGEPSGSRGGAVGRVPGQSPQPSQSRGEIVSSPLMWGKSPVRAAGLLPVWDRSLRSRRKRFSVIRRSRRPSVSKPDERARRGAGQPPACDPIHAAHAHRFRRFGPPHLATIGRADARGDRHGGLPCPRLRDDLPGGVPHPQRAPPPGERRSDDRPHDRLGRACEAGCLLHPRHLPPVAPHDPLRGLEHPCPGHHHLPAGSRGGQLLLDDTAAGLDPDSPDRPPPRLGLHPPRRRWPPGGGAEHLRRVDAGRSGWPSAQCPRHRWLTAGGGDRRPADVGEAGGVFRVGSAR